MKRKFVGLLVVLTLALTLVAGSVQAQDQNIVEIAAGNEDFSTLVTAVQAAGLVDVLADPNAEWTVFAPTNAAFDALPEGLLDTLLADTELLTRVLTYHVVEGTITSDMLSDMMAPSMEMTAPGADLVGSELEVTINDDGTVMINDATVITADILATNGVIHVIDSVLVPPEIAAMLAGDDMMMDDMMDSTLYASLNPGELENDAIVTFADELSEIATTFDGFDGITSVQSVKFTSDGTAYVTVDTAEGEGGILVIEGMGSADSMAVGMGSRMIGGVQFSGLVAPKGLEIIESLDLVLVANFGAGNVKGFSLSADGDAAPNVLIDNFGGVEGSVWDVHYDESTDTLFVANTAGSLLVYATFSEDFGANGPTSTIIPSDADGNQISVNLHGVEFDAESDTIILSDVGAADDNTDGQIFTISGAMMADGNVTVDLAIGGPESMLGNPVDIVWDGSGLYVAEKANDLVLYYPDLLDSMGMMDMMAPWSIEATKAESVTLFGGMMMDDM
ncbi:MAG: fasciclin domain-containing protein [Aggregatilineales bacterium]